MNTVLSSGPLTKGRIWGCPSMHNEVGEGTRNNSYEELLRELEKKRPRGDLITLYNYLEEGCSEASVGHEEMASSYAREV